VRRPGRSSWRARGCCELVPIRGAQHLSRPSQSKARVNVFLCISLTDQGDTESLARKNCHSINIRALEATRHYRKKLWTTYDLTVP
jgi:hypothetical protein